MRIEHLAPDLDLYQGYCDDLAHLLESQKRADRPCTGCTLRCGPHNSRLCACACTPECNHALKQMSSEGEHFPIEAGIAPLVWTFLSLRELSPCWSCEGHEAQAGSNARPPRLIFYTRSTLYPALIAEAVLTLLMQKKISRPWEVVATPLGNMLDATYTLQPTMAGDHQPTLRQMRGDALVIAHNLQSEVLDAARKYQGALRAVIQSSTYQSASS